MDSQKYIDEFIESIPDDVWVELAIVHRKELEKICTALTLDLYFLEEK